MGEKRDARVGVDGVRAIWVGAGISPMRELYAGRCCKTPSGSAWDIARRMSSVGTESAAERNSVSDALCGIRIGRPVGPPGYSVPIGTFHGMKCSSIDRKCVV